MVYVGEGGRRRGRREEGGDGGAGREGLSGGGERKDGQCEGEQWRERVCTYT